MSEKRQLEERDTRVDPTRRRIVMEVLIRDNTPIPFSNADQEWMGEMIEDVLRTRFDVVVDGIDVKGNR